MTPGGPRRPAMFAALLATLLFCVSAVSATRTARHLGGTEANFWRLALALLFLGLYAHLFGAGLRGSALPWFLLSGCIGFGLGDLALFQALPRLGSRLTSLLLHCLAAPLAVVVEWLWLGTRLKWEEMACAALILAGVALALAPKERQHLPRRVFWPGLLFAALAAFGQGFGSVLSRQAFAVARQAGENIDGLSAAYQRGVAGVIFGGLCLLAVKHRYWLPQPLEGAAPSASADPLEGVALSTPHSGVAPANARDKWRGIRGWLLLNALTGPSLGVACMQWALQTTPAGIVLPILATMPIFIIPLSIWFEGEKPTARSLLGGAVAVLAAVLLVILHQP